MSPATKTPIDVDTARAHLDMLHPPGHVFEIRILNYADDPEGRYACTVSGFFNDTAAAVTAIATLLRRGTAEGVYVTLNPVSSDLLGVACNRLKLKARKTASDKDVAGRTRLLIDVDPSRPSGTSATEVELAAALAMAGTVRDHLAGCGFPAPIETMSGNGAGLAYAVELAADDGGLTQRFLAALAATFADGDNGASIDKSVHNRARVTKLAGTWVRKGEDLVGMEGVSDRPHRMSQLLAAPETIEVVPMSLIRTVTEGMERELAAKPTPAATPTATPRTGDKFERFDSTLAGVSDYLTRHGVGIKSTRGNLIILDGCPVNPECESTNGSDIAVIVESGGRISYKNQHDRGEGLKWIDVRDALEPGYKSWSLGREWERDVSAHDLGLDNMGYEPEADPPASSVTYPAPIAFGDFAARYPRLRDAVIDGLLRVGETANIIAASKVGKSWLVYDLALAAATGRVFLNTFATGTPGDVLIVDNELHPETIAQRIPRVAEARGILREEYTGRVFIHSLRGKLTDLFGLRSYFESLTPGRFKLIVIDAWYRALPIGTDENDNGAVAALYNLLDSVANRLGCAFVVIHHASKGNQAGKAVTDVGAGAGSQSRAVDAHIVIRPHELDGAVVVDAACRSFPPITPMCLRWDFPVWHNADDLDPTLLKLDRPRRGKSLKEQIEDGAGKPAKIPWTVDRFAEAFVTAAGRTEALILSDASAAGLSDRKAKMFLNAAADSGKVHRWILGPKVPTQFANRPPDVTDIPVTPNRPDGKRRRSK